MTTGPTVQCSQVSLQIGRNIILDKIDFTAQAGKIHCLIGPNGGGKSSLLKSILGQTRHTGTIGISWPERRGTIGYVPQQVMIDRTLPVTVTDFLALCVQQQPAFLGLRKKITTGVQQVLADVKMLGKEKLLFSELSGGERQRILFAQALMPKPGLLILDEPMNSIDRSGAEIFSGLIKDLATSGVTVIWVHHDLSEVKALADTVSCINRTTVFSGPPSEVMDEKHLLEIFSASGRK
jgi:zinc transport system ATP-binding protein